MLSTLAWDIFRYIFEYQSEIIYFSYLLNWDQVQVIIPNDDFSYFTFPMTSQKENIMNPI